MLRYRYLTVFLTGRAFPDPLLQFLLTQLASKEPLQRSGSLRVIRHYITRLGAH